MHILSATFLLFLRQIHSPYRQQNPGHFGSLSCLPVIVHGKNGWQYDSLGSPSDSATPDAQRIYELLLGMLESWNAHDLEKHLEAYWRSPDLQKFDGLWKIVASHSSTAEM